MANKGKIEKNNSRKRLVTKFASKRAELKKVVKDKDISIEERFMAVIKLDKLPGSATKVRNRCECTGRPRGYYRKLRVSRIILRELASSGLLPGAKKSSW